MITFQICLQQYTYYIRKQGFEDIRMASCSVEETARQKQRLIYQQYQQITPAELRLMPEIKANG